MIKDFKEETITILSRKGYRDLDSLPEEIVDDYVYLNGKSIKKPDWRLPYVLVLGGIGVGKGVYSKAMSTVQTGVQFICAQSLNSVHKTFRVHAQKIIQLTEVNL